MSRFRALVLLLGPIPIVLISIGISRWLRPDLTRVFAGNHVETATALAVALSDPRHELKQSELKQNAEHSLELACQEQAQRTAGRLHGTYATLVRSPFVLAGNISEPELERWYDETIAPAVKAMASQYFTQLPDQPITVLLFADEATYRDVGHTLFTEPGETIFGYYKRDQRTLVLNLETGGGTLVHELTHALVDFDFPEIPDWFNEGLASLHEQSSITAAGDGVIGHENWRLPILQRALASDRLPTVKELVTGDFRHGDQAINYAFARYLCLYLQRQGVLESFYQRFRAQQATDSSGAATLLALFPQENWTQLDQDFRSWVQQLQWQSEKSSQ